eukprot:scaffold548106_cov19-Prasinocladus_malaysianus.AAC.1
MNLFFLPAEKHQQSHKNAAIIIGKNFKDEVVLCLQVEILRKKFDSEATEWRGRQERAEALLAERQQEAARRLRQAEANAEQAQRRAQDEVRMSIAQPEGRQFVYIPFVANLAQSEPFLTARLNSLQN